MSLLLLQLKENKITPAAIITARVWTKARKSSTREILRRKNLDYSKLKKE